MKVLTGILCFYLLALSAIPCIDVHRDKALKLAEFSQISAGSCHNDIDLCSPFCTCICCVSPIIHQDIIPQPIHLFLSQDYNSGYSVSRFSSPPINIWQPPKIG